MKNVNRRAMIAGLVMILLLAGCGAYLVSEPDDGESDSVGKGRYIADEISLEGEKTGFYMIGSLTLCGDGKLRVITDSSVYASDDGGETWKKEAWPQDSPVNGAEIRAADMDRDGNMFLVCNYDEPDYYYVSADGEVRELEILLPELEYETLYEEEEDYIIENELSDVLLLDEEQMLGFNDRGELYLIDLKTGEITDSYGDRHEWSSMEAYTVAGSTLVYKTQDENIRYADIHTGEELPVESVVQEYFANHEEDKLTGSFSWLMIPEKDGEGFYFCDSSGVYRYMFGSSQIEMMVNGATTYLSNPEYVFWEMAAADQEEFYFRCSDGEWQEVLLHYYYSEDVNTIPEEELKVYSLYDSESLRQAVADFQKSHSNYYVQLEIGIGYSEEKTTAEALLELDQRIIDGEIPDVVLANGDFPVSEYEDQFVDLSGMLTELTAEAEYFETILYTYEQDSEVRAVPTRFGFPILAGEQDALDTTDSFETMAAYITGTDGTTLKLEEGFSAETEFEEYLLYGYQEVYDDAGELDEQRLDRYLDALSGLPVAVYEGEDSTALYYWGGYTPQVNTGSVFMLLGELPFNSGYVMNFDAYRTILSINEGLDWDYKLFYENTYLPMDVAAIHQESRRQEAGEAFIRYLLSAEFQQKNSAFQEGLPVMKAGLDALYEENGGDSMSRTEITVTSEDGRELTAGYDEISFTAEHYERLVSECEQLDTAITYDYRLLDGMRESIREFMLERQTKQETIDQISSLK